MISLLALAEIAHEHDVSLFRETLRDDRVRVRAAALRALARIDEPSAREIAIEALRAGASGRMLWAAADVLRTGALSSPEIDVLAPIALDVERPLGQRFRALSLVRRNRWTHLAVLLQARAEASDDAVRERLDQEVNTWVAASRRISRGPAADTMAQIESLLPTLPREPRREIEFVLRTSA